MKQKGTIVVDNTDPYITVHRGKINSSMTILDGTYELAYENEVHLKYPIDVNNHNISEEHKLFKNAILRNEPISMSGKEGIATVTACRAIIESADTKTTIQINYN